MGIHPHGGGPVTNRNPYAPETGILRFAHELQDKINGRGIEIRDDLGILEERRGNPRKDQLHVNERAFEHKRTKVRECDMRR